MKKVNELNDLNAKQWLINTKSVWKSSDYHLDNKDRKNIRYIRNLLLFFTKKNNLILNPDNDPDIKAIGERVGRIILPKTEDKVDFIIMNYQKNFSNLTHYKEFFVSNEQKSKFNQYHKILREKKYLCIVVRDFYLQDNSQLILYHYDLASLIRNFGFNLKGLTIWIPEGSHKRATIYNNDPNNSILNSYILIFRKENEQKSPIEEKLLTFKLNYDEKRKLFQGTLYHKSYLKSISPPRDEYKAHHPATFPEPDIKNLIKFFTDITKNPKILDPFSGVGSSLIACLELNIEGFGIELTKKWIDLTKQRFFKRSAPIIINGEMLSPHNIPVSSFLEYDLNKKAMIQKLQQGDAIEKTKSFPDNHFDFIITSPPYWGILSKKIDHKTKKERVDHGFETKYSIEGEDVTFYKDLANIDSYKKFLIKLKIIYENCYRILKNNNYIAVIVSDFRHGPNFYQYHGDTANILKISGFKLTGLTVLHQDSKNLYPYGYPYSFVSNIHHQFIIIAKKEEN